MRSILTAGGIHTFLTIREGKFLASHEDLKVYKSELTERERTIANQLVRKGVLNRFVREGKMYYTRNVNKVNK